MALQFSFVALTRSDSCDDSDRNAFDVSERYLDRMNWVKCCHQAGLLDAARFTGRFTTSDADLIFKKSKSNPDATTLTFAQFQTALQMVAHMKSITYDVVEAKVNNALRGGKLTLGTSAASTHGTSETGHGGNGGSLSGRLGSPTRTSPNGGGASGLTAPASPGRGVEGISLPGITHPRDGISRSHGHQPGSPVGALASPQLPSSPHGTPPRLPGPPGGGGVRTLSPVPRSARTSAPSGAGPGTPWPADELLGHTLTSIDLAPISPARNSNPIHGVHSGFRTHHLEGPGTNSPGHGLLSELGARFTRTPNTVPDRSSPSHGASPHGGAGILAAEPPRSPMGGRSPRPSALEPGSSPLQSSKRALFDRGFNVANISFKVDLNDIDSDINDDDDSDSGELDGGDAVRNGDRCSGETARRWQRSEKNGETVLVEARARPAMQRGIVTAEAASADCGSGAGLQVWFPKSSHLVEEKHLDGGDAARNGDRGSGSGKSCASTAGAVGGSGGVGGGGDSFTSFDLCPDATPMQHQHAWTAAVPSAEEAAAEVAEEEADRDEAERMEAARLELLDDGFVYDDDDADAESVASSLGARSGRSGGSGNFGAASSMNALGDIGGALCTRPPAPPSILADRLSSGPGPPRTKNGHRSQPPLRPSLARGSAGALGNGREILVPNPHTGMLDMRSKDPEVPTSGWSTAMGWATTSKQMVGSIMPRDKAAAVANKNKGAGGKRAALGLYAKKCDAARGFSEAALDAILKDGGDDDDSGDETIRAHVSVV
ncbi:hypothetical protein FOA52_008627 [Chlamydomonas sp. UWO 241]|nr:hypothetical protein FOA52_008627 [Chlamydomonas sp. UWO 241]